VYIENKSGRGGEVRISRHNAYLATQATQILPGVYR
jgi:hypothetical protein